MILSIQISNPDEFDVMLPVPVNRVDIQPFGDDGAFYSVALKRGSSLQKFQEDSTLSASMMLKEFREEVKKSVKTFTGECQNEDVLIVGEWAELVKCSLETSHCSWQGQNALPCDQSSNSNALKSFSVCTLT